MPINSSICSSTDTNFIHSRKQTFSLSKHRRKFTLYQISPNNLKEGLLCCVYLNCVPELFHESHKNTKEMDWAPTERNGLLVGCDWGQKQTLPQFYDLPLKLVHSRICSITPVCSTKVWHVLMNLTAWLQPHITEPTEPELLWETKLTFWISSV